MVEHAWTDDLAQRPKRKQEAAHQMAICIAKASATKIMIEGTKQPMCPTSTAVRLRVEVAR